MKRSIFTTFAYLLVLSFCLSASARDNYERRAIPDGGSRSRRNAPPAYRDDYRYQPPPPVVRGDDRQPPPPVVRGDDRQPPPPVVRRSERQPPPPVVGADDRQPPPPARRGERRQPPPPVVAALPDLSITEFELNPATPTEGNRVFVRIRVYNRGNALANPSIVQWWPGENYRGPGCTWRLENLPAHGARLLTCSYAGYPSWYARLVTKVVVDVSDAVRESNEGNNEMRRVIQVLRP